MRKKNMKLTTQTLLIGKSVYNPAYASEPFIDFDRVDPSTQIENINLNWREKDLPEKLRTKHVHRLHPYLGKFIPQLVEIFLRKFEPNTVYDPFSGSGTTLVEAKSLCIDSIGRDISEVERKIKDALKRLEAFNRQLAVSEQTLFDDKIDYL